MDPQGYLQVRGGNLYSNGVYSQFPIVGNSCFFRILLASKGVLANSNQVDKSQVNKGENHGNL